MTSRTSEAVAVSLERRYLRAMRTILCCLLLLLSLASLRADEPYVSAGMLKFPAEVDLGPMSAVAVDAEDNVYVLHRGEPPLVVFDAKLNYVRSFGQGMFKVPHGLRIDR
jgi:hypothetical protein